MEWGVLAALIVASLVAVDHHAGRTGVLTKFTNIIDCHELIFAPWR